MTSNLQGTEEQKVALDAFVKLTRAAESILARLQKHLVEKGITGSQFSVLEMIYHLGPLPQGRIGRKMLRSGGNMTLVVDNLEKRGLVRRKRDEGDRRSYIIDLTPAGREFIVELFPVYADKIVEQMRVLDVAELKELAVLCKKVGKQTKLFSGKPEKAA